MLIATIRAKSADEALRLGRAAAPAADLLELRLDDLSVAARETLDGWLARLPRGAIATCRRREEGGAFSGSEEERQALLESAARAGASFVDVEAGTAVAERLSLPPRARRIVSHHLADATPDDLPARAARLPSGEDVAYRKLVTRARTLADNLRLRELLRDPGPGAPLIAFCMGARGRVSRLLALAWGSAATYGSAGARSGAPGQLHAADMDALYRVRDVDSRTRLAGIVGAPLTHSLSPAVHNAAYAAAGLDALFVPLESEDPRQALEVADALGVRRLAVTIPHKAVILPLLDEVEPAARRIGAVNTVIPARGKLGLNTDARGGLDALRARLPAGPVEVAVLGAGGAARAVAFGLAAGGARVTVYHRGAATPSWIARAPWTAARPLGDLERSSYDVLVNATPVGMFPAAGAMPIPPPWIRGRLVFDLVYNPSKTRLLREAQERGLATVSGLEAFVGQAEEQFRLFTGRCPPSGVMRAAAGAALEIQGPEEEDLAGL